MDLDERIAARLSALISKADVVLASYTPPPRGVMSSGTVSAVLRAEWQTQSLALLRQSFGSGHTYAESFEQLTSKDQPVEVSKGKGVLVAALEDVRGGHLINVRSLVAAEIFTDFLDMASHLAVQGYAVAAASVAGAVLEDGLRKIADANSVVVGPKAMLHELNTALAKAGTYNAINSKRVDGWREIRNAADHGRFEDVDGKQVAEMVTGITDFLGTHLA